MPVEYEYVDFEVLKEDWVHYELEDNSILKAKCVVVLIMKPKGSVGGSYHLNSENVAGIRSPENLMGPPAQQKHTMEEITAAIEKDDMEFKPKNPNGWNVYRLSDGATLSVKLELVSIARTTLYDQRGQRIYSFNLQPLVKGKVSPELRRKLTSEKALPIEEP